jgi:MipA family protein
MTHAYSGTALFLIAAAVCATPVAASNACEAPSPECTEVGSWDFSLSFGFGTRTNPIEHNSDIPLAVIPQISYYGKRLFLENLELGFTLHEGSAQTFNLIVTPGYDRVFFDRDDPQNIFVPFTQGAVRFAAPASGAQVRVSDRHTTFLVGPEWMFYRGKLVGQLDALYEVTGEHQGYEVRAGMSVPLIEWRTPLMLNVGFTWKSTELVNYYYGVDGLYQADSAVNPFVKLAYTLPLSQRWTFKAFAHYEHLDNDIGDSPIVSDDGVMTAFLGFDLKIF